MGAPYSIQVFLLLLLKDNTVLLALDFPEEGDMNGMCIQQRTWVLLLLFRLHFFKKLSFHFA